MHVIHAIWSTAAEHGSALHLWAESPSSSPTAPSSGDGEQAAERPHPGAISASALRALLAPLVGEEVELTEVAAGFTLRLPSLRGHVLPSPVLAHASGHGAFEEEDDAPEEVLRPTLAAVACPCVRVAPGDVPAVLDALEDAAGEEGAPLVLGESVRFYAAGSRLVRQLLAQHRFVPMILQEPGGTLRGSWMPWEGDTATMEKLSRLIVAMPPSARAAADAFEHHAFAIIDDFVRRVGDALARRALTGDGMADVIESRVPADDAHVALLTGLLRDNDEIQTGGEQRGELVKGVRRWIGGLEERGAGSDWRLLLRLSEPIDLGDMVPAIADAEHTDESTGGVFAPGDDVRWTLSLHLQSLENTTAIVDASDIWLLSSGAATVAGMRLESPQETLLAELGRAARLYKRLEKTLEESDPSQVSLSTSEAYKFLREVRPILIEQGINVEAPAWWDSPTVRLGARLQIESEDVDFNNWTPGAAGEGGAAAGSRLGMTTLVNYRWQMAVGTAALTLEQFERLAAMHSPLVRLNGQWVEIRPEDIKSAMRFVKDNPGGRMELGRALRLAFASEAEETGVPVIGMDATGWVAKVFTDAKTNEAMPLLTPPEHFVGTLRPYQVKGLSWLAFLDRIGLGACLADDMGLGKTIQLLALLSWERDAAKNAAGGSGQKLPPTLLIVPTSVAPNWVNETKRFTPNLSVMIHHGPERLSGERLAEACASSDLVVTTYALAYRDRDDLEKIGWGRVVLDEAQNIKNPGAKQTRAIHNIPSPRRVALTGTPVENRLGELWSIMDFLNPGYLGPAGEFRRKFAVPIERYHDKHRGQQLRGLVQPFVLRRLKSDPAVITDLPEKVESKEYCFLTPEQASLYQTCVNDMLSAAEKSEGIQRRGVVLAGLIKLKQICNHPGQFLKEWGAGEDSFAGSGGGPPTASRSGKCQRLVEMLEEVVAAGDKALVFTQFRQMGHALAAMLRHALDREVLLLHGGTPPAQRQALINRFQKGIAPPGPGGRVSERPVSGSGGGGPPIFVLSLKAGGVGLNLTAASHVFHFDRWWNPAVESQATDRAFRIGQTRTVQVHKFVVSGTLEERIDQMIEQKMALADEVIGAGEQWLTELSTGQLRDMLVLREGAIDDARELLEVER